MSNQTIKVCALIPTFNRAALLKECLDSLLAQSYPLAQIIVIDDGSTDNTAETVRAYGDRVVFLSQANGGKSSALNLGLQNCAAEFVWICDDDDLAAPDGLESLVTAIQEKPDTDIVFGAYSGFIDEGGKRRFLMPLPLLRAGEPDVKINILEKMITNQFATLVRKSLYDRVGPFNLEFRRSQDYEMTVRLSRDARMTAVSKIIFYYRQHATNNAPNASKETKAAVLGRWQDFDQKIFRTVRDTYALDEFVPSFARAWDDQARRRAALIERGCVFLSHTMIDDAFADFAQALQDAQTPLTRHEIRLMQSVTIRYGVGVTPERLADKLNALKQAKNGQGDTAKRMIAALCPCLIRQYLGGNTLSSSRQENARAARIILRAAHLPPLAVAGLFLRLAAQRAQSLRAKALWLALHRPTAQ